MTHNPVCWFEIYVQDMNRAKRFYEAAFEVPLEQLEADDIEMWTFPMVQDGGGATGSLVKMDGCPPGGNGTLIYFSCADCAVEAKRAADNGGVVVKEKFSIGPYGFIAHVTDTEDNLIGLHSLQ